VSSSSFYNILSDSESWYVGRLEFQRIFENEQKLSKKYMFKNISATTKKK
jgi:hypothetical protein